jgi:hypothetical protein
MRLDSWDDTADLRYDRTLWSDLTSLRFTDAHHGIHVLGPVGVSKTHLASALGHIATAAGSASTSPAQTSFSPGSAPPAWTTPSTPRCAGWPASSCSSSTISRSGRSTPPRPSSSLPNRPHVWPTSLRANIEGCGCSPTGPATSWHGLQPVNASSPECARHPLRRSTGGPRTGDPRGNLRSPRSRARRGAANSAFGSARPRAWIRPCSYPSSQLVLRIDWAHPDVPTPATPTPRGSVPRSVFLARHAGLRSGGMGTDSDDIRRHGLSWPAKSCCSIVGWAAVVLVG